MSQGGNFISDLKNKYHNGGMHIKLIYINVALFLIIHVFFVISRLFGFPEGLIHSIVNGIFTLKTTFPEFLLNPWGIITYMFSHFGLFHLLFNMIFLYFAGQIYESFFGAKKLLALYILGGIAGGILEILSGFIFSNLNFHSSTIIGASGSIMAIFMAVAFFRPDMRVNLFGIFSVKIIYLAIFYLISDFIKLGIPDGTAHFAHLGGAIIGIYVVRGKFDGILNGIIKLIDKLGSIFQPSSHKLKVAKGGKYNKMNSRTTFKKDEDYNQQRNNDQEKVDAILDKISRSGYESLTKAEKDFLFNQSNKR